MELRSLDDYMPQQICGEPLTASAWDNLYFVCDHAPGHTEPHSSESSRRAARVDALAECMVSYTGYIV